MSNKNTHIALLAGGMSAEREVSFMTAKGVEKALNELGYKVTTIDVSKNIADDLQKTKPDIAFIALHGTYGEDGCVQGMLEIMGIPYTHSGVMASASSMNKQHTKLVMTGGDVLCPKGYVAPIDDIIAGDIKIPKPYVLKPVNEGSSVGIYIIKEGDEHPPANDLKKFEQMLVEQYIQGRELSVACIDEKSLGVVEIRPKDGFYDYKNKYTEGKTDHLMPAPVSDEIYNQAMEIAFKAHKMLECRGLSRTDFIYNENGDGKIYFLEINTHPGMTEFSMAPEIAEHAGISYNELVEYLVENAKCDN